MLESVVYDFTSKEDIMSFFTSFNRGEYWAVMNLLDKSTPPSTATEHDCNFFWIIKSDLSPSEGGLYVNTSSRLYSDTKLCLEFKIGVNGLLAPDKIQKGPGGVFLYLDVNATRTYRPANIIEALRLEIWNRHGHGASDESLKWTLNSMLRTIGEDPQAPIWHIGLQKYSTKELILIINNFIKCLTKLTE